MSEIINWTPGELGRFELDQIEAIRKLAPMLKIDVTNKKELSEFFGLISDFVFYTEEVGGENIAHPIYCGYTPLDVVKMYAEGVEVPQQWAPHFTSHQQRLNFIAEVDAYCTEHNLPAQDLFETVPKYREPTELDLTLRSAAERTNNNNVRALVEMAELSANIKQGHQPDLVKTVIGDKADVLSLPKGCTFEMGRHGGVNIVAGYDPAAPLSEDESAMFSAVRGASTLNWPRVNTSYEDTKDVLTNAANLSKAVDDRRYLDDIFATPADPIAPGPNFVHNNVRQEHFSKLANHIALAGTTAEIIKIWASVEGMHVEELLDGVPVLTLSYGGVTLTYADSALEVLQAETKMRLGQRMPYKPRLPQAQAHALILEKTGVDFTMLESVLEAGKVIAPEDRDALLFAANIAAGGGNAINFSMLDVKIDPTLSKHLKGEDNV